MRRAIITREELRRILEERARTGSLYAPVAGRAGYEWKRVSAVAEIADCSGEPHTRVPAKRFLFPASEEIFRFRGAEAVESETPGRTVVFGVRPCDGRALAFLMRFFVERAPADPYVARRRENTLFVGIACNEPADSCFCLGVGGGPHSTAGLDALLVPLDERRIYVTVCTERGAELFSGFPEPAPADEEERRALERRAEEKISFRVDTQKLKEILDRAFEHPVWERLAFPCVNCGACTLLCPTCHCFEVTDEKVRGATSRHRVWDSCQFLLYSQHASGHNPRAHPAARFRNRVMDKFKYTVEQVGEVSCVGCGRCIRVCPAGIDIRSTIEVIRAEVGGA